MINESSLLLQKPLHALSKKVFKGIDHFFRQGSAELMSAKMRGYKKGKALYTEEIPLTLSIKVKSDEKGKTKLAKPQKEKILFKLIIFPSTKYDPASMGYEKNAAGYFTLEDTDQGPTGIIGINLEQMGIPLLEDYKKDVVPSSPYDIRDDKIREKMYGIYQSTILSIVYHESSHAIKAFIYDFLTDDLLGKKYTKYFKKPREERQLAKYSYIGDEREAILASIMSEIGYFVNTTFSKFLSNEQSLVTALNRSETFEDLIDGMLDKDKMIEVVNENPRWRDEISYNFGVYTKPDGEVIIKWNMGYPLDTDIVKWISPKYQSLFKTYMKKLVEWWKETYPNKPVKSSVVRDVS